MMYDIRIWGGVAHYTGIVDRLTALQNKFVEKIFCKYINGETSLFKSFKILKLPDV